MAEYFTHDYKARADKKLVKLLLDMGCEGIGIYWCLIEMLYEDFGYLKFSEIDDIANALRTHKENVERVVNNFDLFCKNGEKFYSKSVLERLKVRKIKSERASESAKFRWDLRRKTKNANALHSECERNALKEKKRKENKIKETTTTIALGKPKPLHVKFVDDWKNVYKQKTGFDYATKASEFVLINKKIKEQGEEVVRIKANIFAHYCENKSEWFTKDGWKCFNIGQFIFHWNELLPIKGESQFTEEYWLKKIKDETN